MKLVYDKATGQLVLDQEAVQPAPVNSAASLEQLAELEQKGIFKSIIDFKVGEAPVGAAAVGGTIAFTFDTLLDKYAPEWGGAMGNAIVAFLATTKTARQYLGDAGTYAALFLIYEAIRDPIETRIYDWINPPEENGTTAQQRQQAARNRTRQQQAARDRARQQQNNRQSGQLQQQTTGSGYYDKVFGRN